MWNNIKTFFTVYRRPMLIVSGISLVVLIGFYFDIDAKFLALFAVAAGVVTNGFAAAATLITLIPIAGPLIVKLLSMPIFYLFNSLGYFLSLVAIKRGYGADVISHRLLTFILLLGVVLGYILGNIFPF